MADVILCCAVAVNVVGSRRAMRVGRVLLVNVVGRSLMGVGRVLRVPGRGIGVVGRLCLLDFEIRIAVWAVSGVALVSLGYGLGGERIPLVEERTVWDWGWITFIIALVFTGLVLRIHRVVEGMLWIGGWIIIIFTLRLTRPVLRIPLIVGRHFGFGISLILFIALIFTRTILAIGLTAGFCIARGRLFRLFFGISFTMTGMVRAFGLIPRGVRMLWMLLLWAGLDMGFRVSGLVLGGRR